MSARMLITLVLMILVISFSRCKREQEYLTVSQVWQQWTSLDGKRIVVRGEARFEFRPNHPLQIGGCSPNEEDRSKISGKMFVIEMGPSGSTQSIRISDSILQCEGDVCHVVCRPFAPTCEDAIDCGTGGSSVIDPFEFVGTLRTSQGRGELELVLDDVDLESSRRLVDGKWESIPTGIFSTSFLDDLHQMPTNFEFEMG